jgi:hypothetical protein
VPCSGVDRTFAAALIDNGIRHKILGKYLFPFSLWHLLLLQVIESPFVMGGEATSFDLRVAVGACRLKYRQSKIKKPFFPLRVNQKKLQKEATKFIDYVGDYASRPEYIFIPLDIFSEKAPLRLTPPPEVVITAFNASHGARITIEQAWNMPIGEAYIAEAMYFRMQGSQLDFMDEDERQFQAEMKEAGVK